MTDENEQIATETQGAIESAPQEKMIPQSQVNDLVGRVKADASEKARVQANTEYQKKLEELESRKAFEQARGNDTQEIDTEKLYQQVHERLQNDARQREIDHFSRAIEANHKNHLAAGKEQYADFDEVVKDFSVEDFPEVVALMSGVEGGQNVLYELAKNPQKLAIIDSLSKSSPRLAQSELRKMGSSISANQQAANEETQSLTQAPLDRMQSSNNAGNSGEMSVSDYRKQPWLKG